MTGKKTITLVLGGARSGKSLWAQQAASQFSRVAFIATAEARDEEMRQRIERHKQERPSHWTTLESPLELEQALLHCGFDHDVVLIDCLTLWTSNLMAQPGCDADRLSERGRRLCQTLHEVSASVVLVSNEVGWGIVPDNALARLYRDLLGGLNRQVAAAADRVLLLVAGLPLTLKDVTAAAQ